MDRVRYLIGLVTLALAVAGGVFLLNLLGDEDKSRYFRLNLEFRSVQGLLPGADVKYRGVLVGSIRRVDLSDDGTKGIATVVLIPGKETLARTNSRFWVVTPRFGGLTSGASGLETLVRDAYVSFYTPNPWGPQLAHGSSTVGLERPYVDDSEAAIVPTKRGDLVMTLLVPENYGLGSGSPVMFRGVQTGEVRSVELAGDGNHVRVALRVGRQHRRTVTDKTSFWVARPRLSGNIMRAFSLDDLSALLSPFVSYYTEPGAGLPVPDGFVVAAEVERPEFELSKVDPTPRQSDGPGPEAAIVSAVQLAHVIYEAVEEDWFSADDQIRREGTGVLFEDVEGRLLVLTARSLCDANYFDRDVFGGDPDILSEGISVVTADGNVLRALRTWVSTAGHDLALLMVDVDRADHLGVATTPNALFDFETRDLGAESLRMKVLGAAHSVQDLETAEALGALAQNRGAAVLQDGRVVGVLGQRGGLDETGAILAITEVPEALRPSK